MHYSIYDAYYLLIKYILIKYINNKIYILIKYINNKIYKIILFLLPNVHVLLYLNNFREETEMIEGEVVDICVDRPADGDVSIFIFC